MEDDVEADLFAHAAFVLEKCNAFGDKWREHKMVKAQPPNRTQVKCPYCETLTKIAFPRDLALHSTYRNVTTCDVENGGCDRDFVYRVSITPKIEVVRIVDDHGEPEYCT